MGRGKRVRVEKSFGSNFYTYLIDYDHRTYGDAMKSIDVGFGRKLSMKN